MAKKQQPFGITAFDARQIIEKGDLTSELEMERAVWAERSLRLLSREQPELDTLRRAVREMIIRYESIHWSDSDLVTHKQICESESAERQVEKEFSFIRKRKELILNALKQNGLNQNDLAAILSHSKSYTSELLSGTRAFAMNDLIIIHKLFNIALEDLIRTEIPTEIVKKFKHAVEIAAQKNVKVSSKTTSGGKYQSDILKGNKSYDEKEACRKRIIEKYS